MEQQRRVVVIVDAQTAIKRRRRQESRRAVERRHAHIAGAVDESDVDETAEDDRPQVQVLHGGPEPLHLLRPPEDPARIVER
jgi:hypothetical protein